MANKPVLFYGIEAIRDAGITDIGIVVGETQAEIRRAVGDGSAWDVRVTYIEQPEPLGLAHAVLTAEEFLGDDEFVMYLGDNLILDGISELVEEFRARKPVSQVLLAQVPNPSQFGVAELEGGKIRRLVEKPKDPTSDLALVGVYMFDRNVLDAVKAIRPSARGELEITDAIQWLVDQGFEVVPHVIEGWWKDTGKLEDMLEANRMVLDQIEARVEGTVDPASQVYFKVVIDEGAVVEGSTIRGPAIIGKGSTIVNSFVGPFTSIHDGCLVRNSEIEHSIVLADSSIIDVPTRIADSLIGHNVTIERGKDKPSVLRFMLGDNSAVGII